MSAFGAYNMAGNVAEWTSNDSSDGFLATGGAWGDPTYTPSHGSAGGRASSVPRSWGFAARATPPGAPAIRAACGSSSTRKCLSYAAPSPQAFAALASSYRYEKTPLDAAHRADSRDPRVATAENHLQRCERRPRDCLPLPAHPRGAAAPGHALPAGWRRRWWVSIAARLDGRPLGAIRQRRPGRVRCRAGRVCGAPQTRGLRPSGYLNRRVRGPRREPRD